ncbi:syntaxin-5-like [Paramacrobiotus metropolitanus]|uniref:syntaxin-5-like n=1 Tax=Paramacrobiotus metropolitanus TaxID=2943436 RepID=UPI0024464C39|nr:syntaxin-5-like [Paramacrobiotus metropolitanus]
MSKDRTQEFSSIVRNLQQSHLHQNGYRAHSPAAAGQTATRQRQAQFAKEFMGYARNIGKDLSQTYAKLEKLTLLSKKKSLFDDRGSEIEHLSQMIKEDIQHLNQQISKLEELKKHGHNVQSTPRHHLESHSTSVVIGLQSSLAKMSTKFKEVLEIRTENMKQQQERRDKYSSSVPASEYIPSRPTNSILLQPDIVPGDAPVSIDMSSLTRRNTSQQQQQMQLINEQDAYIQSRADAVQNIESTIVELGGIFQQLAHMVKEQEEVVQRIDMHVEDAESNIEAAHDELLRYFRSISSNRWLMAKVFGILLVFFFDFCDLFCLIIHFKSRDYSR